MICPDCGEPDCDSECLLIGTGAPGRDRRAWLRAQERDGVDELKATVEDMKDSLDSKHLSAWHPRTEI